MSAYTYTRRLGWSECDPGGIVFFPNYAKWAVDGLNDMFIVGGHTPNRAISDGVTEGIPCVELAMRFMSAPALHSSITHEISVTRIGSTSFTAKHRFLGEDVIFAEITDTRVWAIHENHRLRKCPLPAHVIDLLKARQIPE